jgi:uncharacterized protein YbjT (DUF2867 family)
MTTQDNQPNNQPNNRVLVAGATGGVGQLTVAKLLETGFTVRVLVRHAEKSQKMFNDQVEIVVGDIRDRTTLPPAIENIDYIICCTGTTAFPSTRWEFDSINQGQRLPGFLEWLKIYFNREYCFAQANNSPEKVDAEGVSNLVSAAPKDLNRFVFVSSCGILRKDKKPYSILNSFGVLDAKEKGETAIAQSGLPYTIIRPARLIDGPFTSYDLNTLLKATTGGTLGIVLGTGDTLSGQTSRIDVAAACVECLNYPETENTIFELINIGTRPETIDWKSLFSQLT